MDRVMQTGITGNYQELTLKKTLEPAVQYEPDARVDSNHWLAAGKWIFAKVPARLQLLFKPFLICLRYYRYFRLDQWLISGEEINSRQRLNILYTGIKVNKNYISHLAFGENNKADYLGKKWLWQVKNTTVSPTSSSSLTITETPKFFRKWFLQDGRIYIPQWVVGEADIPDDLTSFIKHCTTLASNSRKIKTNNLQYQITNDHTKIMDFLVNMYVPYISNTHGDRAIIQSLEDVKKKSRKYSLLLIQKDGIDIAGCLFQFSRSKGYMLILGVKDGNMDYVKQGAIGAIYHFFAHYALENGYKSLNLGKSRAFLKDGILSFKKKWGMKIVGSSDTGFIISVTSPANGVKGFLLNNPFIFLDKDKYKEAVFFDEVDPLISDNLHKRSSEEHCMKGISEVVSFRLSDQMV
jgi:hypothetical protein